MSKTLKDPTHRRYDRMVKAMTPGSNYLQGYFFSKPVPVDEFARLLERSAG